MVPPPHYYTDQSRIVYLVRLSSIWNCKLFVLFGTLDMPDEGSRWRWQQRGACDSLWIWGLGVVFMVC